MRPETQGIGGPKAKTERPREKVLFTVEGLSWCRVAFFPAPIQPLCILAVDGDFKIGGLELY
jgi:hypothetical protein